jgi:hypothetical protein
MKKPKKITESEMQRNLRLQAYYPLGEINAIWSILDYMCARSSQKETKALHKIYDAVAKYDDLLRERYK